MKNIVIICADVGSVKEKNFGWWSSLGEHGDKPSDLAAHVSTALKSGAPVALGFECPLFIPLEDDEQNLTRARPGEGNRPWSVGAGCAVLATGLVQTTWVLQKVKNHLEHDTSVFLSWDEFSAARSGLYLWEAFVSGKAKAGSHEEDAKKAVEAFERALPDPTKCNAVRCDADVYSLVGAALLRTGWSEDLRLLHEPCLVVRASP